MKNDGFKIVALPENTARELREKKMDDAGNQLVVRRDASRHQCRSCLKLTEPWEEYLAVSYAPMPGNHAFVERGPIYIHERQCERYRDEARYPVEFPRSAVVLRAYGASNEIEDAKLVGEKQVEDVIRDLFENARVQCVHARNSELGCFMFKVERALASTITGA